MKKNVTRHKASHNRSRGFTLIELLIVIVILTALAVTVFVALNPVKRLIDARDARRSLDVENISKAIREYTVDSVSLPPSLTGLTLNTDYQIGNAPAGSCTQIHTGGCNISGTNCVNLGSDLVQYLKSIPIDPLGGANTIATTGYAVTVDANNIVTVKACRTGVGTTEGANDISNPPYIWPNLVQNPSFESGTSPWFLNIQGTAAGTYTLDNTTYVDGLNSAKIAITAVDGSNWHVQFGSHALALTGGQTYQVTFYAKSDISPHSIQINEQQNYSPWTSYYNHTYNLTTTWTKYTAAFTAPATDNNTVLVFNVGSITGTVWIDTVSIQ
jgi:prepilin-type N-terminal cleavage/methylation domain-containing protein